MAREKVIGIDSSHYAIYTWSDIRPVGRRKKRPGSMERATRLIRSTGAARRYSAGTGRGDRVVTKKEIVRTISEEIGLTQLKTKEIVQKTFDAIVETLVEDGRIELRNFGVFEVKRRAPRKARNPRTGDKVDVPEKFVVTFKPGKEMEARVRELERQAAAAAARTLNDHDDDDQEPTVLSESVETSAGYGQDQ